MKKFLNVAANMFFTIFIAALTAVNIIGLVVLLVQEFEIIAHFIWSVFVTGIGLLYVYHIIKDSGGNK